MTVKLLADRPIDGKEYKAGNLCDTDDSTEAGLISSKLAIADLTGGTAYVAPTVQQQIVPVTATTNDLTGVISITGPGNYRKVIYPNVSVSIGLAPNVTWDNTGGGFTSPTDFIVTYSHGLWLYFNGVGINGTTGGPATSGYYWCIMSSTTQGVAYAEKFDPTLGSIPKRVANPTALITVTGANAPTLNTYITAAKVTIAGGSIGANGILKGRDYLSYNNSATLKSSIVTFSSTTLISNNAGGSFSTQRGARREYTLYNIGFEDRNLSQQNIYTGSVVAQAALGSIDTAVDQQMTYILSTSSATDFILFNSISLSSEDTL